MSSEESKKIAGGAGNNELMTFESAKGWGITPWFLNKNSLKVFTCTKFEGHWPVGVAAVMVAPDQETALAQLNETLTDRGLVQKEPVKLEDIVEVDLSELQTIILNDGNY